MMTPILDATRCAMLHRMAFDVPWSEQSFRELLQQQGVEISGDADYGFLLVRKVSDEMEILTLAVHPDVRREGHAERWLRAALERAKSEGVIQCFLEVDQQNTPAIRLYEKLGFNAISIRRQYYAGPDGSSDAVVMRLQWQ